MKINLKEKNMELTVNTYGAYIEKFTKEKKPIFFPKLLIKIKNELKTRGGMHPCLPNFGKSEIKKLEEKYGIKYLYSDFKKKNGYKDSIDLSKKYNLYRQDYCGCVFSFKEMQEKKHEK